MDSTLEFYENLKTQQLRDSVSSVLSSEKSLFDANTPGSSPASSIRTTSRRESQHEPASPYASGRPRRDTSTSSNQRTVETPVSNRHSSLPVPSPVSSKIPRKTPLTRSSAHQAPRSVSTSPSQRFSSPISTPPANRSPHQLPTPAKSDRPRWNVSTNLNKSPIGHNFRPLAVTTPSPYAKPPPQKHYTPARKTPSSTPHSKTPTTNSPLSRRTSVEPSSPATPHFSRRAVSAQMPRSHSRQASSANQHSRVESRPSTSLTSSTAKQASLSAQARSRVGSVSVAGDSPAMTPSMSMASSRRISHASLGDDFSQDEE